MAYAQETNRYLNQEEPWKTRETDRRRRGARALHGHRRDRGAEAGVLPVPAVLVAEAARDARPSGRDRGAGLGGDAAGAGDGAEEPAPLFKKLDVPEGAV